MYLSFDGFEKLLVREISLATGITVEELLTPPPEARMTVFGSQTLADIHIEDHICPSFEISDD